MPEIGEGFSIALISGQPTCFSRNPKSIVMIFKQGQYAVARQTVRVFGVMVKMPEFVAIIAIETKAGSKPHKPTMVLQGGIYRSLGQAIRNGEMIKFEFVVLAKSGTAKEQQNKKLVNRQSKFPRLY